MLIDMRGSRFVGIIIADCKNFVQDISLDLCIISDGYGHYQNPQQAGGEDDQDNREICTVISTVGIDGSHDNAMKESLDFRLRFIRWIVMN